VRTLELLLSTPNHWPAPPPRGEFALGEAGVVQVWSWRYSFSLRNGSGTHTKWATQLPRENGMVLMISRTGSELFNEIADVAKVCSASSHPPHTRLTR